MSEYQAVLAGSALRSLQSVPPRIAEPLVAFVFGGLAADPRRRGNPLHGELEGLWTARRDFRVVYRLDDTTKTMIVLKIAHRANAYRPR